MSTAKQRRAALRKLLLGGSGGTQDQLVDRLARRGFATTQSTMSRDLRLLGAQRRVGKDGAYIYRLEQATTGTFPAEMVTAIEHNEVLVVVRTRIGRAQAVGVEIDALRHPDVLGTIAGDDTVLVIPKTVNRVRQLAKSLREVSQLLG